MDSIDFELKRQILEETSSSKEEYLENLRLAYKIYMNSFY